MKRLIRDELGSMSLLLGSGDHNDGFAGYAHLRSMFQFDVTGTVTLCGLTDAKSVRATALTAEGGPLGEAFLGVRSQNGWTLKLGTPATAWWLLEVER